MSLALNVSASYWLPWNRSVCETDWDLSSVTWQCNCRWGWAIISSNGYFATAHYSYDGQLAKADCTAYLRGKSRSYVLTEWHSCIVVREFHRSVEYTWRIHLERIFVSVTGSEATMFDLTGICFHSWKYFRIVDMIDQHLSVDIVLNTDGAHMAMDSRWEQNDDSLLVSRSVFLTWVLSDEIHWRCARLPDCYANLSVRTWVECNHRRHWCRTFPNEVSLETNVKVRIARCSHLVCCFPSDLRISKNSIIFEQQCFGVNFPDREME